MTEIVTAAQRGRRTTPWSWYSDPEILRLEQARIFRKSWQYAGHLGELQGPGSYFASETGPFPMVVTLDRNETLRAFLNVCPHRGTVLACGSHKRGTLQCPYHAWTFDLDGALRAAPRSDADPALDFSQFGLREASVGTWGPFIFANPDPDADALETALDDLPAEVAAHGLDVNALRHHRRYHYDIRANWKIALENYLECYHCTINHPGLVQVLDERRLELVPHGLRASQYAPIDRRSLEGRGPLDVGGSVREAQNHLWFPTMKFNMLPGHPNLSIGPLWPTGPETCSGYLDYWFGDEADSAWIESLLELDNQIGAEDTGLVEAVQRGVRSGMLERGWVLGGSETLIGQFQDYIRERLGIDR